MGIEGNFHLPFSVDLVLLSLVAYAVDSVRFVGSGRSGN